MSLHIKTFSFLLIIGFSSSSISSNRSISLSFPHSSNSLYLFNLLNGSSSLLSRSLHNQLALLTKKRYWFFSLVSLKIELKLSEFVSPIKQSFILSNGVLTQNVYFDFFNFYSKAFCVFVNFWLFRVFVFLLSEINKCLNNFFCGVNL